jgi:hypothetical protein
MFIMSHHPRYVTPRLFIPRSFETPSCYRFCSKLLKNKSLGKHTMRQYLVDPFGFSFHFQLLKYLPF